MLRAAEAQAIEVLLISDKLFRAQDVVKRKKFVKLVDEVREYGGDVKIFSSMHVSGEQLEQLTGVCAILRFPMQELDDSDSEDEWKLWKIRQIAAVCQFPSEPEVRSVNARIFSTKL